MKKNINVIWDSEVNIDDFKDYFEEEGLEDEPDDKKFEIASDINNTYLEDEKCNLNIKLDNPILVIANLGLWIGRANGYKFLNNKNLNEIFDVSAGDSCKFYYDGKDIRATDSHHDGTNYYLFREVKNMNKISDLTDEIYANKRSVDDLSEDINKYTKSLAPHVRKVYGWK